MALILATVLGPLQSFLDTVGLSLLQWLICLAMALTILVVSEIWKAIQRRTASGHALQTRTSS